MAFNINRMTIVGRLGADAEFRSFSNGGGVVNLRVATSEQWKDKDGMKQERTEWHTVAVFNKFLIDDAKLLRKGDLIMVEGKLQTRKWQDQSGNDRYSTEVVLQGFDTQLFKMAPRDRSGGSSGGSSSGGGSDYSAHGFGGADQTGRSTRPQPAAFDADLDDDVPFITCDIGFEGRVS
ncbi:MAG: single-stranded DNA-binding protein [Nocardioides sp.]